MTTPDLTTEAGRTDFRNSLLDCLGGVWPDPPSLDAQKIDEFDHGSYRIEKIRYQVEPGEFVSAFVLVPNKPLRTPAPAVAVWHQHHGEYQIGKSEPAGLMGSAMHHAGVSLAEQGFIVICPDAIGFEERRESTLKNFELEHFLFLKYLVSGKCLAWKNILDMRRAIDYICSRDDVDEENVGCYGHSLGSTFGWMIGPWEPRLKCVVGNCCLPTYEGIVENEVLHSFSNYVPGLLEYGDTPEIASLIAPRELHLNFGARDAASPISFVRKGLERIERVYGSFGASSNFTYLIEEEAGHTLTATMWDAALDKLKTSLAS